MAMQRPTAAIVVIGDEILKGHTQDSNSSFAAKILYRLGVRVCRITAVSDTKEDIVEELRLLSARYTFVLTSGGVGPTHDDITFEAVAATFDLPLVLDEQLVQIVQSFYGVRDLRNNPALKMARVPQEHELFYADPGAATKKAAWATTFPLVKVRNVYVLPGLPECFEACLQGLQHCFPSSLGSRFMEYLFLRSEESLVAHVLEDTLKSCADVVIGCYPVLKNPEYETKLTVEAGSRSALKRALDLLTSTLPAESIVQVDAVKLALDKLQHLNSHEKASAAFEVFAECHQRFPDAEIAISFNGGKDCTLLLHLYHLFLRSKGKADQKTKVLYIRNQEPFREVEQFLQAAVERYNLHLIEYNEQIKPGVDRLLRDHPKVEAVLMGNRSTDPYSSTLSTFKMTDEGWPQVMRVFPLLEWSYAEVWQAILLLGVEYCSLYDQGYSSLGNPRNTAPNPALRYEDEHGVVRYRPAHVLVNGAEERAGRNIKATP